MNRKGKEKGKKELPFRHGSSVFALTRREKLPLGLEEDEPGGDVLVGGLAPRREASLSWQANKLGQAKPATN